MNYQKLDSALVAAVGAVKDPEVPSLTVFIHTTQATGIDHAAVLEELGIRPEQGRDVLTARLSVNAIHRLSDQPWVRSVRLARNLRLRDVG